MFGMLAKLTAQPGKRDDLAQLLLESAGSLEGDEDCLLYVVNRPDEDPDAVWVTEAWRTKEAHAASLEREDVRAVISRAAPLLAGSPEAIRVEPLGGKGLPGA